MTTRQIQQIYFQLKDDIFGAASHTHERSDRIEKLLKDKLGQQPIRLLDQNTKIVVTATRMDFRFRLQQFLFGNYEYQGTDGQHYSRDAPVWEACRSSTAAPMYFTYYKFRKDDSNQEGMLLSDGGLMANNPSCTLLRQVSDTAEASCTVGVLLSLGTGQPDAGELHSQDLERAGLVFDSRHIAARGCAHCLPALCCLRLLLFLQTLVAFACYSVLSVFNEAFYDHLELEGVLERRSKCAATHIDFWSMLVIGLLLALLEIGVDLWKFAKEFNKFKDQILDQIANVDGLPIEDAKCMLGQQQSAFFRLTPPMGTTPIELDETGNGRLTDLLWSTMEYFYAPHNRDQLKGLVKLLHEGHQRKHQNGGSAKATVCDAQSGGRQLQSITSKKEDVDFERKRQNNSANHRQPGLELKELGKGQQKTEEEEARKFLANYS